MANGKYFNKMDFPVKFRQVWLPGAPSVELHPGNQIEGPNEYLKEYSFLSAVPFDFHKVEAMSFNPQYKAINNLANKTIDLIPIIKIDQHTTPDTSNSPIQEEYKELEIPATTVSDEVIKSLPFDLATVNWIQVKTDDLEIAAKLLGIDTTNLDQMKPKEKKWNLVKALKKILGKTN